MNLEEFRRRLDDEILSYAAQKLSGIRPGMPPRKLQVWVNEALTPQPGETVVPHRVSDYWPEGGLPHGEHPHTTTAMGRTKTKGLGRLWHRVRLGHWPGTMICARCVDAKESPRS